MKFAFAMNFSTDIHVPQKINPTDLSNGPTFNFSATMGFLFVVCVEISQ